MALFHTSVIVTAAATDTRTRDQLSFPFTARPQAMTIYLRFVDLGAGQQTTQSLRLIQISDSSNNDPRLIIGYRAGASGFAVTYDTGAVVTASATTTPASWGDRVEILVTLTSAGVATLSQSINGGAIVSGSASSPVVIPQAWSGPVLWVNSVAAVGGTIGFAAYRNIEIQAGVHTMQEMRVRAGTD